MTASAPRASATAASECCFFFFSPLFTLQCTRTHPHTRSTLMRMHTSFCHTCPVRFCLICTYSRPHLQSACVCERALSPLCLPLPPPHPLTLHTHTSIDCTVSFSFSAAAGSIAIPNIFFLVFFSLTHDMHPQPCHSEMTDRCLDRCVVFFFGPNNIDLQVSIFDDEYLLPASCAAP